MKLMLNVCLIKYDQTFITGLPPTCKTLKTWNFIIFFSMPGKCLEFAQKVVKTWNFNSKPRKKT